MHRCRLTHLMVAGCLVASTSISFAAEKLEWGNLSATFIYDGEPPERAVLPITKDRDFIKEPYLDESLLVDPKSKGIGNVVLWLVVPKDAKAPAIHESYDELEKRDAVMDVVKARIQPHVLTMWTKQKLVMKQSDPIGHALKADPFSNRVSSLIPAGGIQTETLTKPEPRPFPVSCGIHPWMIGYVLVQDHPYSAVSNTDGRLIIKNLPVGKHTFAVWHEKAGFLDKLERGGSKEEWKSGRVTVDIKPGESDLGEIRIKPEQFK